MTEHTPPTAEQIINELVRDEQVKVHGFGGDVGANAVWRDGFEEGMTRLLAALRSSGVLPETPSAAISDELADRRINAFRRVAALVDREDLVPERREEPTSAWAKIVPLLGVIEARLKAPVTDHDPRPPTDDELLAWRKWGSSTIVATICDALLSERAAHLATRAALRTVRDELDKHGHGDFHYGTMPRNPKVLAALEVADRALADPEEPRE